MGEEQFNEIKRVFDSLGVAFEVVEHEAVRTSEEAAAVRGTRLSQGVKAMVIRIKAGGKKVFLVAALPADRRVDLAKLSERLKGELKLARPEEVLEVTGCEVGGVPPFGHGLPILFDSSVFAEPEVEFNAGLKTRSIKVSSAGLRKAFESIGAAEFDLASSS